MSVQSSISRVQYIGNNSTVTAYVIPFFFQLSSDLKVVLKATNGSETLLTEVTDYVVTGAGDANGGSLVTTMPRNPTFTLTIYREVAATQLTTYAENDAFPATSHERALDKLTFLVQQMLRGISRCFRVTEASSQPAEGVNVPLAVVGTDGGGNIIFRNAGDLVSFLSLGGAVAPFPGATWADVTERVIKTPDYAGQLGIQRDTRAIYISTALTPGAWSVATVADGALGNAQLSASAAIAFSKLATLNAGNVLVGSAGNVATSVALSGDATMAASGALTIGNDKITTVKILDANVTAAKLAAGAATANLSSGSILKVVSANTTSYLTSNPSIIPKDDTLPQSSEGAALLSASITPSSASNSVRVRLSVPGVSHSSGNGTTFAIFRGSGVDAVAAGSMQGATNDPSAFLLEFVDTPATASSVTYSVRFGPASGTSYVNGNGSSRLYGGVAKTTLTLEEIKA